MTLFDILNWGLTILWLGWGTWVYMDARKHNMEKKLKWTLRLMVNPFAMKKYKKARAEQT